MYRVLPVSRNVASSTGRGLVRASRRRLATEAGPTTLIPKKKRGVVSKILWTTAGLTGTFYVGSTFVAFNNQTYYDFFSDNVPLGQSMLEYAEYHCWDTLTLSGIVNSGKNTVTSVQHMVSTTGTPPTSPVEKAKHAVEQKAHDAKVAALGAYRDTKERVKAVTTHLKTDIRKEEDELTGKKGLIAKHQAQQFADEVADLVRQAEAALGTKDVAIVVEVVPTDSSIPLSDSPTNSSDEQDKNIYTAPLPLGFEPPFGFKRPAPPKPASPPVEKDAAPPPPSPLPLVAPAVLELAASEPVLAHLAGTIDNLASYLNSNPEAADKAKDVLETAKEDLKSLATRIDKAKEEERIKLEAKLDEQTREYTLKLLETEMEGQDKLDNQEQEFRQFFELERGKFVQSYREKLEHELRTQTELINERLKEEVIAQGIEMQRRWIREIKVRVEQERGGRLAKLDELSANLKRLERVALDNSAYLDENIRIHSLWSALRAVNSAIDSPVRKPFREELRVLRHIATAREDPIVASALSSLEGTDVPDIGVEPFADLASWFSTSVAPRVSTVALVPDQNAGVLSHLAAQFLSTFRFSRHGLVPGEDVLSVLARAEYYLNEKDLDSAARELNQLRGSAKVLLHDWLEAARRRLEVQQAIEVVQTQATLATLLVV